MINGQLVLRSLFTPKDGMTPSQKLEMFRGQKDLHHEEESKAMDDQKDLTEELDEVKVTH